jgi:hypothetical protein
MLPRPARVVSRFLFLDIFGMKVHSMFVIGKHDMEADGVSVHGKGNLGAKPCGEAIDALLLSIKRRRVYPLSRLPALMSSDSISSSHFCCSAVKAFRFFKSRKISRPFCIIA